MSDLVFIAFCCAQAADRSNPKIHALQGHAVGAKRMARS